MLCVEFDGSHLVLLSMVCPLVRLDHENYFFNIKNVFTLFLCEAEIFFTLPLLIEKSALIEDIEILCLLYNERIK